MTVTDFTDLDEALSKVDDADLVKSHARLDAIDVPDLAQLHAHHALCREMTKRGLDHGHTDDDVAKVRIQVETETYPVEKAADLGPDMQAAIEEVAKATDADVVTLTTVLTVNGYEMVVEKYNHSHDSRGRFGSGGSGGGVSDAAAHSIIDRVSQNGGLTVRPNGKEPAVGYMVAVRGHNKEIPEAEFFDPVKGPQHIAEYVKAKRDELTAAPGEPGRWLGFWHDTEHGEVVIDIAEQHRNRDSAIRAGQERNQQAIWDVKNMAEIATGGTGDRAEKARAGAGAGGLRVDDGRADRRLEPGGVGEGGGGEPVAKRQYVRDGHGRFAAVGSGGRLRTSERHGSDMLESSDKATIKAILNPRTIRQSYNEGYESGVQMKDAVGVERLLGQHHDSMMTHLQGLRSIEHPKGDMGAEVMADALLTNAGFIDGAMGRKRAYKMNLFGPLATGAVDSALGHFGAAFGKSIDQGQWESLPDMVKRNYTRDYHGRFAVTGGGHGILRPGDQGNKKPDLITLHDPYGDEIHVTKAMSLYDHLEMKPDGHWGLTAERQALHEQIMHEALDGVPESKNPTMYMLGGGPAAGKTTMLEKGGLSIPTTGEGGSKRMAVLVNADEVKVRLPEYSARGADGANFVHEESSLLAKKIQAVALAGHRDIVLDGTGDSKPQKLAAKIAEARQAGYRVEGHYATVPTEVAVQRAHDRGVRTGRVVGESVVRSTHSAVSQTFPSAHHLFDHVTLYDTMDGARKIAEGKHGSNLDVLDPAAYAAFLAKGQE